MQSNLKIVEYSLMVKKIESIINSMDLNDDYLESFTTEAYNSKEQKIKFDSKINKYSVEDVGYILITTKYLDDLNKLNAFKEIFFNYLY